MSEKDYLGKVKGESGLLEKIIGYVPGYRGYKEKELRRESDRLIRMALVNRLKDAKTVFRRRFTDPTAVAKLDAGGSYKYDAFTYRLDRVTQRIDRAVAGYAGMFDAIKVREDKLEAVIQHDVSLMEKVQSLKEDTEKMASNVPGTQDWSNTMDDLISKVEYLDKLVDERANILRGL
jgi:hypothetical protein